MVKKGDLYIKRDGSALAKITDLDFLRGYVYITRYPGKAQFWLNAIDFNNQYENVLDALERDKIINIKEILKND